eukprot:1181297-Prymnesium_polylepis.2
MSVRRPVTKCSILNPCSCWRLASCLGVPLARSQKDADRAPAHAFLDLLPFTRKLREHRYEGSGGLGTHVWRAARHLVRLALNSRLHVNQGNGARLFRTRRGIELLGR